MGTEAGRDAKERERERETVSDASVAGGRERIAAWFHVATAGSSSQCPQVPRE